jgi:hypothetical protein
MRSERRVFETPFERHTPSRPSRPGVYGRKVQVYRDQDFSGEAEYDIHEERDLGGLLIRRTREYSTRQSSNLSRFGEGLF